MRCRSLQIPMLILMGLAGLSVIDSAVGQSTSQSNSQVESRGYSVLYVHADAGSDTGGDGSQMRPFGTITHALEQATPQTIIVLAAGQYTEASGEIFPLRLRPGVTVQAAPDAMDQAVIQGGNTYLSPSQGLQNITLLAVDGAGLGGVSVTNPYSIGVGLWIEAGRPVVRESLFVGNGRAGVVIAAAGAPVLQDNRFTENLSGLLVQGLGDIEGNVFEGNGVGIQVFAGATPRIANNRIKHNQDGLILHANARPVLRSNVIAQNRRNGLVEFPTTEDQLPLNPDEVLVVPFQDDPIGESATDNAGSAQ